ncbi:MAG: hypothetical protein EA351_10420 [Gemmatimonadales bacterium]|nr:MAG: hypothetical protein EA351_10420 [Gemmatimonadales bacterium]
MIQTSRTPVPRLALLLGALLMLTACGLRGEGATPAAPVDSGAVERPESVPPAPDPASAQSEPPAELRTLLLDGERLLAEGNLDEAIEAFQGYLAFGGSEEGSSRALWGLSLAFMVPDTETHDPERGLRALDTLVDDHPLTLQGQQAQWLRGLIVELGHARAVAREQEQLIEQLSEMVEQLRRIDLDRRPGGVRPDSLRRPPPS